MRFSESLVGYLVNRKRREGFRLGEWMESLDDEMLAHLQQLSATLMHSPESLGTAVDDFLALILSALAAERQTQAISFGVEQINEYFGMLGMIASLERLRRDGLISFRHPLSIEPDADNTVTVSKEAHAQAQDIMAKLRRGFH